MAIFFYVGSCYIITIILLTSSLAPYKIILCAVCSKEQLVSMAHSSCQLRMKQNIEVLQMIRDVITELKWKFLEPSAINTFYHYSGTA